MKMYAVQYVPTYERAYRQIYYGWLAIYIIVLDVGLDDNSIAIHAYVIWFQGIRKGGAGGLYISVIVTECICTPNTIICKSIGSVNVEACNNVLCVATKFPM